MITKSSKIYSFVTTLGFLLVLKAMKRMCVKQANIESCEEK